MQKPITNTDIEKLATMAMARGDTEQVWLCAAALEGDEAARTLCERVIEEARFLVVGVDEKPCEGRLL